MRGVVHHAWCVNQPRVAMQEYTIYARVFTRVVER